MANGENCPGCADKAAPISGGGNRLVAFKPLGERGPTVYRDMTGIAPEHMVRLSGAQAANLEQDFSTSHTHAAGAVLLGSVLSSLTPHVVSPTLFGDNTDPSLIDPNDPKGEIYDWDRERREEAARRQAERLAKEEEARRQKKIEENPQGYAAIFKRLEDCLKLALDEYQSCIKEADRDFLVELGLGAVIGGGAGGLIGGLGGGPVGAGGMGVIGGGLGILAAVARHALALTRCLEKYDEAKSRCYQTAFDEVRDFFK